MEYQKPTLQNIVFFIFLFVTCVLGSIGIFIFGVGMETGNRIVSDVMTLLVANAGWVFGLFGLFNVMIWLIYRKGRRQ